MLFHSGLDADVTAITNIMLPVAVVLPILISIAAVGSQFSAAVADTSGAGGLLQDIVQHKLSIRYVYLIIMVVTIMLTWATNVNEIIAYASRAFALFYFLQSLVASIVAHQQKQTWQSRFFALISIMCFSVFVFGIPSGG